MNKEEFISSGILESYKLGSATSEERKEVENMASAYPEIKLELDEIEKALNSYTSEYIITPPDYLKEKILSKITGETKSVPTFEKDNLRRLGTGAIQHTSSYRPWAIAASILLLISIAGNAYLMVESGKINEILVSINKTKNTLSDSLQTLTAGYKQMVNDMAILKDPMYKIVELKGMKPAPDAKAMVCWCPMDRKVYVEIDKLPPPPQGMQYQLWAFVDGKPVSEGMLTMGAGLHRMPDIDKAQSFAVTLEQQGGSPLPKGDIYAMGSI